MPTAPKKTRILLVSYSFSPSNSVGAFRLSYWAERLIEDGYEVEVFTATPQPESATTRISYVKDDGFSIASYVIKDRGLNWLTPLRKALNGRRYDWAILSGNPFLHFSISRDLSDSGAKVLLDFRDPFSDNPAFKSGPMKNAIKRVLQKTFLNQASKIVTVNETCANLLRKSTTKDVSIIENGFDERRCNVFRGQKVDQKFSIAYAGKFLEYRNPNNLIHVITSPDYSDRFSLHVSGPKSHFLSPKNPADNVSYHGELSYEASMRLISSADCGLILTGGEAFESTTKMYDYIGLKKKILIVTGGTPKTGEIAKKLNGYQGAVWAYNSPDAIRLALDQLIGMPTPDDDDFVAQNSRAAGYIKLKNLMEI